MNEKVSAYFQKQVSPQKEICLALRHIILKTFPNVTEEMKWGVPAYDGGRFYIGVVRYGVNLGFSIQGLSDKEKAFFDGDGKVTRNLKFESIAAIDEKKIVMLLRLVKNSSSVS